MSERKLATATEEGLVLATLLGDMQAFDELVRRFRGAVMAVAQQAVGSREVAEEVAQETFLLAFKALPQLDHPAKFAGWLYAITRHRARRVASRERRSEATEASELDRLVLEHSSELALHPADAVTRKFEQVRINRALEHLPPDYQLALRLHYLEEWTVARIAQFLSLPLSTVKWRLHHGRELMRRQLTSTSEENHGTERQSGRSAASGAPVATDHAHRKGSQYYRQSRRRHAVCDSTVQPHPGAP